MSELEEIESWQSGRDPVPVDPTTPFIGTPFAPRTAALAQTPFWYAWGPFHVVDVYTDPYEELKATRETASLNEMSPLSKIVIEGPDATRLVDRLITRDATKMDVGQILYAPWCNEAGRVVGDGLVIREEEDRYVLSAGPSAEWFELNAEGLDARIDDISPTIGILALQGPRSLDVLNAATGEDWSDLRFSRLRRGEIGGVPVDVLRQGFTGELGYELWVGADDAVAMWDGLIAAGEPFDILPCGEFAVDIARVEAGLILVWSDYTGAGPDPTVAHFPQAQDREVSPFEIGLGHFVDFEKGDFVGKQALVDEQEAGGPPRRLVGLDLNLDEIVAARRATGLPPSLGHKVIKDTLTVSANGDVVGRATSLTWSPAAKTVVGFGVVATEVTEPGTQLSVEWAVGGSSGSVSATVVRLPFLPRKRAQ